MNFTSFTDRFFRQLPVIFPIVGLFLIALTGYNVIQFGRQGVLGTGIALGTCAELLLYTLLWLAACDRRRWGAIGFILLTAANLLLYFLAPKDLLWHQISDALLPFDALLCFFLLFFFKRFR
ncbi:MAG: hypothetical protein JST06_03440 [Bacteroidetes bacterium]|nr:hypothetical protein [Bacteroidota bacterium]MBS1630546.1 hypothetical protein [Bacteroidota bacterium]